MFALFVIALLAPLAVESTQVLKCGGNVPLPSSVDVVGCTKPPCGLKKGSDALVDVKFQVPKDTATLNPQITAVVGGLNVPYPLPPHLSNACEHLKEGASCPLKAKDEVTYELKVPVLQNYPKLRLDLIVSLLDDSKKPVACFKVPCAVVD